MTTLEREYFETNVRNFAKCAIKLHMMGWKDACTTNFIKMNDNREKLGLKDVPSIEALIENPMLAEEGFQILK